MSKTEQNEVFVDTTGVNVQVQPLNQSNIDIYVEYILENDKVPQRQRGQNRVVGNAFAGKTPRERRAETRAEERAKDEHDYFLLIDEERSDVRGKKGPVVGQAKNYYEDGATEMRVEINDTDYRGMRAPNGKSLYDLINEVRISRAQGIPYVCTINEKAQYKMENTEFDGREFQTLKWSPNFKREPQPGALMALEPEEEIENTPAQIYVPDFSQNQEEFIDSVLNAFYEETPEIRSRLNYRDFSPDSGLDYRRNHRCADNVFFRVEEGSKDPSQVYDEILDEMSSETCIPEIRVDAEIPESRELGQKLIDDNWFFSGMVPGLGEEYPNNEISYIFPREPTEYHMTESTQQLFEAAGIPYSPSGEEIDLDQSCSHPVVVGEYSSSKGADGEPVTHTTLYGDPL